ncbi:MAG: GAF domain-containing protein [Deltaproteobacteria bacterium]|nr:GAF domain-containing protein [Deltaproteobacteria bacterium]
MRYQVIGPEGFGMDIEGVDWMMAMCEAIRVQEIEVASWACWPGPLGKMLVTDPQSGRTWMVEEIDEQSGPREEAAPPDETTHSRSPYSEPGVVDATFAPDWGDPAHETFYAEEGVALPTAPPEDLAERLFDLCADIADAQEQHAACHKALEVALGLVPCAAGSVLRGTINDDALTFVAASGPAARKLLGRKVPFGRGLVGAAYDQGVTIQVRDVSKDHRHLVSFDKETGFATQAVVCSPVCHEGSFYGVIELLNPPVRFEPWHVDVVEAVARSLAAVLSTL